MSNATTVTVLNEKVTKAYDALEAANLNFTVEQGEIMNTATGKVSQLKKSLYRSDNGEELGVVGMGYQPVQNFEAFSYFDSVCELNGAHYSKCISIDGGAKIILKAEFPQTDLIAVGDEVRRQFILVNGHNGNTGLMAQYMIERLVCTNGLRSRSRESSFKFKHTKNVIPKMDDALQIMHQGVGYFDNFIMMSKELAQKHVDRVMVDSFLDSLIGTVDDAQSKRGASMLQNKRDAITGLFVNGTGNKGETAWDLYNAVTEYADHFHGNEEKRENYNYFGGGVALKEKAFDLALSL